MLSKFPSEFRISPSRRHLRVGVLLIGILLMASQTRAVSVRPVVKIGVIQSIDPRSKMVSLSATDQKAPLVIGWDQQTRFIENGEVVDANALRAGTRVEVRYFHPFFGKKFATEFRWNRVTNAPVAIPSPARLASDQARTLRG